jgi:MOSC domain-containing protein YiiM
MTGTGRVHGIQITATSGAPMESVERVRAFAGRGLEGDRYHTGVGEWSDKPGGGRGVTLVSAEAIEAANAEHPGLDVEPRDTRRNVTVRGLDLNDLVGREFLIGDVRCVGVRLAEPCAYLQGLLGKPILPALVHRAGLRADILTDGVIAIGDAIVVLGEARATDELAASA